MCAWGPQLEVQGSQVSGAMKTTNRLTGDQLAGRHKVEGKPSAVTLVNNNEVLAKDQQVPRLDTRVPHLWTYSRTPLFECLHVYVYTCRLSSSSVRRS